MSKAINKSGRFLAKEGDYVKIIYARCMRRNDLTGSGIFLSVRVGNVAKVMPGRIVFWDGTSSRFVGGVPENENDKCRVVTKTWLPANVKDEESLSDFRAAFIQNVKDEHIEKGVRDIIEKFILNPIL
jgi:hypothetical protein